jgi:hypothetical protein
MRAVRRAVAEGTIGELHGAMPQRKGYYGGFGLMDVGTHMILATSPGPRSKTVYARRARSWSARQRRRVLRERSADRHGRRVGVFGSGRRSPGWAITGSPPRT